MLERAAQLFPARREGILLLVFWLLAEFGIIFSAGMGMRSVCGGIFAAALLWLSFLDLRDGMLYDCITLPFAALGLIFDGRGWICDGCDDWRDALRRLILLPVYRRARRSGRRGCEACRGARPLARLGGGGDRALDRIYARRHGSGGPSHHGPQEAAQWNSVRPVFGAGRIHWLYCRRLSLAPLLGDGVMRCRQERGIVLLNILLALSIFAVLLSTVLPAARSIYAHAAVEYEAMCLISELRRVQAISRTTAMPLYMMERPLSSERAPQIRIRYGTYELHHPFQQDRVHMPLPFVRITQETMGETPVAFTRNGDIERIWSHNMKIRVYAQGYEHESLYVVIDRAARIRLQRGGKDAADEEE